MSPGNQIHFIGIGGSGMAPLAEILHAKGYCITGSEIHSSESIQRLMRLGISVSIGHFTQNITNANLVVVSDAIPKNNVEILEANLRGIPVIGRSVCLNKICNSYIAIMVAGSHGKTTTGGMISVILDGLGLHPTYALGANVKGTVSQSVAIGSGPYFVAEACEAFQNLKNYDPSIAVICNIDNEHIENYKDMHSLENAFLNFINRAKIGSILNGDDPGIARIIDRVTGNFFTYGFGQNNRIVGELIKSDLTGSEFSVTVDGILIGIFSITTPGTHNILNALAAISTALLIGGPSAKINSALKAFLGITRRMERYKIFNEIELIDDFAHHPNELKAAVDTIRQIYEQERRLIIIFQPQMLSRTKQFGVAFAKELSRADLVILLNSDKEKDLALEENSNLLIDQEMRLLEKQVIIFDDEDSLAEELIKILKRNDILLVSGTGTIKLLIDKIKNCSANSHETDRYSDSLLEEEGLSASSSIFNRQDYSISDTVLGEFLKVVEENPSAIAISDSMVNISYAQLDCISSQIAAQLVKRIKPNEVIAVSFYSSIELIALVIAIYKVGAIYLPIDMSLPLERIKYMLKNAQAKIYYGVSRIAGLSELNISFFHVNQIQLLIKNANNTECNKQKFNVLAINPNRTAYICFTSGTTGKPKGVLINHKSLLNLARAGRSIFNVSDNASFIANTAIGFDVSIGEMWIGLCGGAKLVVTSSIKPLVGNNLVSFINQNLITHLCATPSILKTLPTNQSLSLTCIISAGEICSEELANSWPNEISFFNAYGPTEATVYATVKRCSISDRVTIGQALPGVFIRILNEDLDEVPMGEIGEIYIGGIGLAEGYIDSNYESISPFIRMLNTDKKVERLYRTGDLGRLLRGGDIEYIGRRDSQIKLLGNRIELDEIDVSLSKISTVQDSITCFVEHNGSGKLISFILPKVLGNFKWSEIRNQLALWLPEYMIPVDYKLVDQLPLSVNGKKHRALLSGNQYIFASKKTKYLAPQTEIEEKVLNIWKTALHPLLDFGMADYFYDIGGDSLKVLEIIDALESSFGIELSPGYLGVFTTPQQMALKIYELLRSSNSAAPGEIKGFQGSYIYKRLRDLTVGWDGERNNIDSIILSKKSDSAKFDFFICIQNYEEYQSFATRLDLNFNLYGMRSGHLIMDYSENNLEALTQYYFDEILSINPQKEIIVGGICQGSLVAIRLAKKIQLAGRKVKHLFLFESGKLIQYSDQITFFYTENSPFNPHSRFKSHRDKYSEIYNDKYAIEIVPGTLGEIHLEPQINLVVKKIMQYVGILNSLSIKFNPYPILPNFDIREDRNLVLSSNLFDANFYISNSNYSLSSTLSPIDHFLMVGYKSYFDPSHKFSMADYLNRNLDVASQSMNPLLHYLKYGIHEKRHFLGNVDLILAYKEDLKLISESGLFNEEYYKEEVTYPINKDIPAVIDYLLRGWRLFFDPGPLFSTSNYLKLYCDVAQAHINPLIHFLKYGVFEGRVGWTETAAFSYQKKFIEKPNFASKLLLENSNVVPRIAFGEKIVIFAHSKGNIVFLQFQELITQAFIAIGVNAVSADESSARNYLDAHKVLVIAPHEFFFLGGIDDSCAEYFSKAMLLNTEQLSSSWFAKAYPFLKKAPIVFDINLQMAASLRELGISASFLPLGYLEGNEIFQQHNSIEDEKSVDMLSDIAKQPGVFLDWHLRPIDLLWIGTNSKRRQDYLERNFEFFASEDFFIKLVNVSGTLNPNHPDSISSKTHSALSQRAKILLNIHHFNNPYFEWQRIVNYGLMQGCCVVTEKTSLVEGLIPGVHYFEKDLDSIPPFLEWLLNDVDGRLAASKVAHEGKKQALSLFKLDKTLASIFLASK